MARDADIIHDLAFDHYGRRVATCSSDNTIKVFDQGHKVAEWKAHSGSIWRLSWAHPEFGVALASCSFDRKVCIWEETGDAEEAAVAVLSDGSAPVRIATWRLTAEITDARDSVVEVQFAPHHVGLRIASCGVDGMVRIHEAPDVLDLSSWENHSEFDAATADIAEALPSGGSQHGGVAVTALDAAVTGGDAGADSRGLEPLCLAWSTSIVEQPMIVVGRADGSVLLWKYDEHGWARTLALSSAVSGGRGHLDSVRSVSWAADMGRSYQLLATGSRDKSVKLWALRRGGSAQEAHEGAWAVEGAYAESIASIAEGGNAHRWTARCCAELPHRSQVWRLSWNASGSMLATSEDDGTVRIFKMDAAGGWQQAQHVPIS